MSALQGVVLSREDVVKCVCHLIEVMKVAQLVLPKHRVPS